MARIVIDARIINSSTGRYVERLLTHLQNVDTENEYIVLVPEKDKGHWKSRSKNFSVDITNYKNYSLGEQLGFAWQLYRLRADLVHFCMPQQPLLYFKPHVTTVHDITLLKTYNSDKNWLVFHLKQLIGQVVFFLIGHTSRRIITPSKFTRDEYIKFARISPRKVALTYEAAEVDPKPPKKMKLKYKQFLMYVGQQADYKNIKRLIKTHQHILRSKPDLGLVLVGSKSKANKMNEAWVEKKGYKNITFTGFVSDDQLAWLYKNCGVYIFPSLMEGFGLPGLEAMEYGAPVASSNATCLPEIYDDAAVYFDPKNIEEMAGVIEKVLENESVRQELIKKGYKQAKKYSWNRMAKQTHKIYLDALEGK